MNDTVDIDAFLNLNEYDDGTSFASPELSPPSAKTPTFLKHEHVSTPPSISPSQPMCGPSHDYGLYKQQTPFAPGAIQMTFATMEPIVGYNSGIDLFAGPSADFDFNATPSQGSSSGMDLEFGSPSVGNDLSFEPALHSAVSDSQPSPIMPATTSTTSNVGRMWPGMHQQAALAKAQAQERQQQQMMAQQRRIQAKQPQPQQHQRAKSGQPTDPIVEQKITQLLNSMRAKPASHEDTHTQTVSPLTRIRKDEEDMDEDERLLASEEGKKLTSKERRQLRNKVSARAFRSRRKEYITQLEAEITSRVTENGDLRSQNRALLDENRRLTDLTKMLLSSPSFSNFLDQLSTNPSLLPQAPQAEPQQQAPPQPEPTPAPRQMPKDVNPNSFRLANGGQHQQQIGLTLVPEQPLDLTSLGLGPDSLLPAGFEFAPQVFTAVIETPDLPEVLASKPAQRFDDETLDSEDDGKVEFSATSASYPVEEEKSVEVPAPSAVASPNTVDEDDGSDLFDDVDEDEAAMAAAASMPQPAAAVSEKPSADRIEITVAEPPAAPLAEEEDPETVAEKAMKRVEKMVKRLESLTKRFEDLAGL